MSVGLRFASRGDAATLARLQADGWRDACRGLLTDAYLDRPELAPELMSVWTRILPTLSRPRPVIAVDAAGLPMGFCAGGPPRGEEPLPYDAEIYALYVAKAHWRRGVGAAMLGETAALLRKYGAQSLIIWALADNHPACAFYAGLGGTMIAREEHPIGGTILPEAAFLWRDLTALERLCFARAAKESCDVRA